MSTKYMFLNDYNLQKNVTGAFYIITIGTPAPVRYGIPTGILGLCVVVY